jgi:class III poly(R)-hydroxyalkanoic acid synthase PhaE subunit
MRFDAGSSGATPATLWSQAFETWWKTLSGDGQAVFSRMVEQGKSFFLLGQQMSELFRNMGESIGSGEQWQEALKSRFDAMKASLDMQQSSEWAESMKGLRSFFEMPMDTWRRTLSGASMLPGDFMQTLRSQVMEGMGDKLHEDVDRFLSVPGVGYTRESQEQLQHAAKLTLDYQKAVQEYGDAHVKLSADALDVLYKRIVALTEKGEKITSLREFYDLWVDSSEEVYGKFAMSPEFQEIYARMVNTLMRLKLQARNMIDEMLAAFNMPTRREMNTIIKRQHELRRELRALQRSGDGRGPSPRGGRDREDEDIELSSLRSEVASLREQVSALQAALRTPAPAPVAAAEPSPETPAVPDPALRAMKTPSTVKAAKATRVSRAKPRPGGTVSKWDIGGIVAEHSAAQPEAPGRGSGGSKQ